MRILVDGANGAIGRSLLPRLRDRGHQVVGITRTSESADAIRRLDNEAIVADGLDAEAIRGAARSSRPDAIVHEMANLKPDSVVSGRSSCGRTKCVLAT